MDRGKRATVNRATTAPATEEREKRGSVGTRASVLRKMPTSSSVGSLALEADENPKWPPGEPGQGLSKRLAKPRNQRHLDFIKAGESRLYRSGWTQFWFKSSV